MEKFIVVEVWDREAVSATECATIEEAVQKANALLRDRAKKHGWLDYFNEGIGEDDYWSLATLETLNAWDNHNMNWDAHIIQIES